MYVCMYVGYVPAIINCKSLNMVSGRQGMEQKDACHEEASVEKKTSIKVCVIL